MENNFSRKSTKSSVLLGCHWLEWDVSHFVALLSEMTRNEIKSNQSTRSFRKWPRKSCWNSVKPWNYLWGWITMIFWLNQRTRELPPNLNRAVNGAFFFCIARDITKLQFNDLLENLRNKFDLFFFPARAQLDSILLTHNSFSIERKNYVQESRICHKTHNIYIVWVHETTCCIFNIYTRCNVVLFLCRTTSYIEYYIIFAKDKQLKNPRAFGLCATRENQAHTFRSLRISLSNPTTMQFASSSINPNPSILQYNMQRRCNLWRMLCEWKSH